MKKELTAVILDHPLNTMVETHMVSVGGFHICRWADLAAIASELTTLRSLVAAATQFELQAEHDVLPGPYKPQITAHRMRQFDGSIKWAVRKGSEVLNKKGKWEYEPMPSSRTDKFLERTRFDSLEAAIEAFEALREK